MKQAFLFLFLAFLFISAAPGESEKGEISLVIGTFPEGPVLRGEIIASRGQFDALVQGFSVLNSGDEDIIVSKITFEVFDKDNNVLAEQYLSLAEIEHQASQNVKYQNHGVFKRFDSIFGFSSLIGPDYQLTSTNRIKPSEGIIFFQKYFAIGNAAAAIRIRAFAHTENGGQVTGETNVAIEVYKSPNRYLFPLSGAWFVNVGPEAGDHHRWSQSSEFAIDAIRISPAGRAYAGDGASPENYLAYGAPVFAASDGVVVRAVDGVETAPVKQPEETYSEFFNRMSHRMNKFFDEDPEKMMGNYVVIQHRGGEYSSYSHLKSASVTITEGQVVKAGQKIGEIGQSGNSLEPHLHFNVGLGPDPLWGRSVPVVFENLAGRSEENLVRLLRSGEFVYSTNPEKNEGK